MIVLAFALTAMLPGVSAAGETDAGFLTSQPAMLTPMAPNGIVKPIMTVGDTLPGGYRFEAIPDGIAIDKRGTSRFGVYVNHETSLVPFPLGNPPTAANTLNDFDNAQLSHLQLKGGSGKVVAGSFVIPSSANYQRFCSNFIAGAAEGFSRPLLFTNEEATDIVNRTGTAWPATSAFGSNPEQAGVAVAYDLDSGAYRTIYGLGRMNHENTVAIPGYDQAVLVTGDDTFSAPSSQFYMYVADDADAVWNDEGHLWAFVSDDAAVNDYGDLSGNASVSGHFIQVPDTIADGNQTGLETWSNANNVFQFIRVEDLAYDRNQTNVIYFADTGEPRALPDATTGRLRRGPSGTAGPFPNGRIFRMELDPADPLVVTSLSILIDGDPVAGQSNKDLALIHNPDNVETTGTSLMIQEDPGGQNQYAANDPAGTAARIWRYNLATGALSVVATVDQSLDPAAPLGSWESSGIVDASAMFGRGAFLVNVQAHSIFVETAPGPDLQAPVGPDWTYKREGGQMLLLRIPDA
jgi:hypothetical protein